MNSKINMTVKMTHLTRENYVDLRVRTQPGKRAMKLLGDCMRAGGTVAARTWYDDAGDEWMEATLDWSTGTSCETH